MLKLCLLGKLPQLTFTLLVSDAASAVNIELPPQLQDLLFYLALNLGKPIPRAQVAALFWPHEASRGEQLANLRSRLNQLRKRLAVAGAQDYIDVKEDVVAFNANLPHWIDVDAFTKIANDNNADLQTQQATAGWYGGVFFADRSLRKDERKNKKTGIQPMVRSFQNDEDLDHWIEREHEVFRKTYVTLLKQILDTLYQNERWEEMLTWVTTWQTYVPGHDVEKRVCFHMLALKGLKNSSELERVYLDYHKNSYWNGEIEALYKTLQAPPVHLPQIDHFVGRVDSLDQLYDYLEGDNKRFSARVISIWGLGGMGKTTLALKLAHEYMDTPGQQFTDGAYFVSAENVRQFNTWLYDIAKALDFRFYTQNSQELLNFLREKAMLLIFDGLESLLTHDKKATLDFITQLFHTAPKTVQLITSRERLGLSIERGVELKGLDYAVENEITSLGHNIIKSTPASELFCKAAIAAKEQFKPDGHDADIARICRLTEGMPLALKLAAANVEVLPPREIADRIQKTLDILAAEYSDLPERHWSIQAIFESSWQLLNADEQRVFAALSVFRNGFTLEAAEQVAQVSLSALKGLTRKSLVQLNRIEWSLFYLPQGQAEAVYRYHMHALLRRFAADKLQKTFDMREVNARFVDYFLRFAQNNAKNIKALEPEWHNLLDAMTYAADHDEHAMVIAYAYALGEVWYTRGRYTDSRVGFKLACSAAAQLGDDRALVNFLAQWGRACVRQGDYVEAEQHFERGLKIGTRLMDALSMGRIQYERAQVAIEQNAFGRANECLDECVDIYEELNDQEGMGEAFRQRARIFVNQSQYQLAEPVAKLAHDYLNKVNNPQKQIMILRLRSEIASELGAQLEKQDPLRYERYEEAKAYQALGLKLCDEIGDLREKAMLLYAQARVARIINDWSGTINVLRQSGVIFDQLGDRKMQAYIDGFLGYAFLETKQFDKAKKYLSQSLEKLRQLEDPLSMINPLYRLGVVYLYKSEQTQAVSALTEAALLAERFNVPKKAEINEWLKKAKTGKI